MGLYLEKIVVIACIIAVVIISIVICCFIYENFVSKQHLKWDVCSRAWVSEEERVEIPDIGGHTSVERRGLNREPVGDSNLPPREVQYPQQQRDGRALEVSRDADSSQQQNKNKRNVIIGELGHSGRQGREYRGKSTGDHNLPSRDAQYPGKQWDGRAWVSSRDGEKKYNMTRNVIIGELGHGGRQGGEYRGKSTGDHNLPSRDAQYPRKQWDGRSWVESRDPQSSQQQYINTRNMREERLKVPVPSASAVLELEKPTSSQGGNRERFTRKPTGDNNDSDLKEKKTKNLGELSQQERREVKLKAPVPSAPAVIELKEPRSLEGGQTCCVCMTQTIEIIFNCAHAATCEECAKSLCVCPICRADITSRNRIYISGI